ncbi:UNVERIFIED_CONTAM: NAC transcription factor 56 [Sesamum angustifolium]|uniref:NAC transcription factor 56 n=1 Tax=Sesamum angustifolium TaxID=2727405 RepID=A0AAW2QRZ7_9LAMI
MTAVPPSRDDKQNLPVAPEETPAEIAPSEKKLQACFRGNYPPGFHFMPSDAELILEYLKKRIQNLPIPISEICEVNLYQYNPQHLAGIGSIPMEAGLIEQRAPGTGRPPELIKMYNRDDGKKVGSRKALVFYEGRPPKGKKTDWIMHEYRVKDQPPRNKRDANDMRLDDWFYVGSTRN